MWGIWGTSLPRLLFTSSQSRRSPPQDDFSRLPAGFIVQCCRVCTCTRPGPGLTCPDQAQDGSSTSGPPPGPRLRDLGPHCWSSTCRRRILTLPLSCDSRAHPSASQPVRAEFNNVVMGVITVVNYLPAISSFCRPSALQ